MFEILVLSISLLCLLVGTGFVVMVVNMSRYFRYKTDLYEREITMNYKIDANDYNLVDNIINDVLSEYVVLNVDLSLFINSEAKNKMIVGVTDRVYQRLTDTVLIKLEVIYNKNEIPDIISHKIALVVSSWVENQNLPK